MRSTLSPPAPSGDLMRRYLAAALDGDEPAAAGALADAIALGRSSVDLAQMIGAALEEVGRLWELAEISIAEEHMATEISSSMLQRHVAFSAPARSDRSAIVACAGAETHVLGARAWAGVLAERGWQVTFLGAAVPPVALAAFVAARRPTLVALSVKMSFHLDAAADAARRIKRLEYPPAVIVGGRAVLEARTDLDADLAARDLETALAFVDALADAEA